MTLQASTCCVNGGHKSLTVSDSGVGKSPTWLTGSRDGLVYWGLTPQQQPGSYQGGEMMMMKSVIWWRKPEYPEETTDLRQVTDETFHT